MYSFLCPELAPIPPPNSSSSAPNPSPAVPTLPSSVTTGLKVVKVLVPSPRPSSPLARVPPVSSSSTT